MKKGKHDISIAHYTKMIEANPADFRAYNNRGNAYACKWKYDQAIEDYNKAIELNPTYELAYINRGNAFQKKWQYRLAMSDYNKAIELNPKKDMAYNNRGFNFILMGRYEEAKRDIETALSLNTNNIYAHNSMAELCAMLNDADGACKWLRKAIDKGYNNWSYIKTSPTYKNVRDMPCFRDIILHIEHKHSQESK